LASEARDLDTDVNCKEKCADGVESHSGGIVFATDSLMPANSVQFESSVHNMYSSSEEGENNNLWDGDMWQEEFLGPICGSSFFEATELDALPLGV
jgi:hypothetical protein